MAKPVGEALDGLDASGDLEARHCPEAGLLPAGDVVTDVRREAGVVELLHRVMPAQRFHDRLRVLDMLPDAHVQRAKPAQREVAVEGRPGDAERVAPPLELI